MIAEGTTSSRGFGTGKADMPSGRHHRLCGWPFSPKLWGKKSIWGCFLPFSRYWTVETNLSWLVVTVSVRKLTCPFLYALLQKEKLPILCSLFLLHCICISIDRGFSLCMYANDLIRCHHIACSEYLTSPLPFKCSHVSTSRRVSPTESNAWRW